MESQEQVSGAFNACQGRGETQRTGSWRGLGAGGTRGLRVMSHAPDPTAPREARLTAGVARDHQAGSGAGSPRWTAGPTGPTPAPAEMKYVDGPIRASELSPSQKPDSCGQGESDPRDPRAAGPGPITFYIMVSQVGTQPDLT